jgi:hypothetical protein
VGALIVASITEGARKILSSRPAPINNLPKEPPALLQNLSPSMKPGGEAAIAAADPMVAACFNEILRELISARIYHSWARPNNQTSPRRPA